MVQGKLGVIKRKLYGKYAVYDTFGKEISELSAGSIVLISLPRSRGGYLRVMSKIDFSGLDYYAVELPHVSLNGLICRILLS